MRQTFFVIFLSLLSFVFFQACQDDSTGVGSKPDCITKEDCPQGYVCVNEKCEEGVPTSNGQAKLGESCQELKCEADLSCVNNICAQILQYGQSCDVTDASQSCDRANALYCIDGYCGYKETCESDNDCKHEIELSTCLSSGVCGTHVELGGYCDELRLCADGVDCKDGTCLYNLVNEDDICDDAHRRCDYELGLWCISGLCKKIQHNLDKGSECNGSYLFCSSDLDCLGDVCTKVANENESCKPEEHTICAGDLRCLKGLCTPVGAACESSIDCLEKDSYCCLSESCGAKNECVPYDEDVTHDETCRFLTKPGIFEAQVQCRWQPPADQVPGSKSVEMPPLVGKFGNKAGLGTVVAFYSYSPTVIRFIHPETCETLESITTPLTGRWYHYPSAVDIDGDGLMELVVLYGGNTYIYRWDETQKMHVRWKTIAADMQPMVLVYDIDADGENEFVSPRGVVFRAKKDGDVTVLNTNFVYNSNYGTDGALGNLDQDAKGIAEFVAGNGVFRWDTQTNSWIRIATLPRTSKHMAYADFGTMGTDAGSFDFKTLDGKPEIVAGGGGQLYIYAIDWNETGTLTVQEIMSLRGFRIGGPLTVGDFNNDGYPEIGVASQGLYGVYDPKCTSFEEGKCADTNVLWERWSQDESSGETGSSLFDFDGDGQAEAVYADECFTRVYDGKTGAILFSARRSSNTSIEGPVVADIDGDGSAEIIMGSDASRACRTDNNSVVQNGVDPIHEGIRCQDDEDCPLSKNCNKSIGLCLCESDADCNTQFAPGKTTYLQQYVCTAPIHPSVGLMTNPSNETNRTMLKPIGTRPDGWVEGSYKVCRASRITQDIGIADVMIFKDRLDRWVSSRPLWNQHAYNIINIEDSGLAPTASQWLANWLAKSNLNILNSTEKRPLYNNYRLNKQGKYGAGMAPDITGRFIAGSICGKTDDGRHVISAKLCNRGTKPVSTNLPASFYLFDEAAPNNKGDKICTSYTKDIVAEGVCQQVGCEITAEALKSLEGKRVLMVANENEHGLSSIVECNDKNNTDNTLIEKCEEDIIIVN